MNFNFTARIEQMDTALNYLEADPPQLGTDEEEQLMACFVRLVAVVERGGRHLGLRFHDTSAPEQGPQSALEFKGTLFLRGIEGDLHEQTKMNQPQRLRLVQAVKEQQ